MMTSRSATSPGRFEHCASRSDSANDIADDMNLRLGGGSWLQQTVDKVERSKRQVRLSEAVALADILGADLYAMLAPTPLDAKELALMLHEARSDVNNLERELDHVAG